MSSLSPSSTALLARWTGLPGLVLSCVSGLLLAATSVGLAGAAGNEDCTQGTVAFKIEPVRAGTYTQAPYTVQLSEVLESRFAPLALTVVDHVSRGVRPPDGVGLAVAFA